MKRMVCWIAVSVLAVVAHAETYRWAPVSGPYYGGSWDNRSNWTAAAGGYAAGYPNAVGDVAHFYWGGTATAFAVQLSNMNRTNIATVGGLSITVSNTMYMGSYNPTCGLTFVSGSLGRSVIAYTNVAPDGYGMIWMDQDQQFSLYGDYATFRLSNDLDIISHSLPCTSYETTPPTPNYEGDALFTLDDYIQFRGDYTIRKYGLGEMLLGVLYDTGPTAPEIRTTKPFMINDGLCYAVYTAVVEPPFVMNTFIDCQNYLHEGMFCPLGLIDDTNVTVNYDVVLTNGGYYLPRFSNWSYVLNSGSRARLTIADYGYVYTPGNVEWNCDVRGFGTMYKGWEDKVVLNGSISPGVSVSNINWLRLYSMTNEGIRLGASHDPVDLNIEINGLHDSFGEDADALIMQKLSSVDLGLVNLKLFTIGQSNPYRTNEIMYSPESAFIGNLNSVTWSNPGRTGEVIVTPQSVFITGIPPLSSNFFDLLPDQLVFVQGETQKVLTARGPYSVALNVSNDSSWITAPATATVTGAPVDIAVSVPATQPVTNGYGMSSGSLLVAAAADTASAYRVEVLVVQPGYFELDTATLNFFSDQADYFDVWASSPLTVGLNVSVVSGGSWLTLSRTSLGLTNSSQVVRITGTAQPGGTSGLIRFANAANTAVFHDVVVRVLDNGFFEVAPSTLEFALGETQKFFTASSPWRAVVDVAIAATDSWIVTAPSLSLADNTLSVPVIIPADQPNGSSGTITLTNRCVPGPARQVTVTVVPEPLAAVGGLLGVLALLRRRK